MATYNLMKACAARGIVRPTHPPLTGNASHLRTPVPMPPPVAAAAGPGAPLILLSTPEA